LFVPILFFTIYFNFFYNAQIGIRFYLVIFPFLYVFAGSLFMNWHEFLTGQKASAYVLGAYLVISVLSYFPNYIPYFNELVWNRNQAYKYLADSNLDWSQNKNKLDDYLAEHPDVTFPRTDPTPGHFIVSVNRLVGVTRDPTELAWLRKNFEPVGNVAYSYLLYEVSPQQIESLCQTADYCE
jgi:energy-coupling factor transporter transmembrane protein EcfT